MTRLLMEPCLPYNAPAFSRIVESPTVGFNTNCENEGSSNLFVTLTANGFSPTYFPEYVRLRVFLEQQSFAQVRLDGYAECMFIINFCKKALTELGLYSCPGWTIQLSARASSP